MGSVYAAHHPRIGKRVALKVIHPELATNEEMLARFFNEARAVTQIGHENIVEVQDYGQSPDGESFIVMELLEGRGLGELLKTEGALSVPRAVHIGLQLADGLAAAHARGIIHRDLKPDNIMLIRRGSDADFVKILDFGLAKLTGPGSMQQHKTRTGSLLGTAHYMAPEAAESKKEIDHRVDIYALGCIIFQMLAGRVPFPGEGFGDVLIKHIRDPPPLLTRLNPQVPKGIEKIVLHALAKKPEFRFSTMDEFRQALRDPERFMLKMDSDHGLHMTPSDPLPAQGGVVTPFDDMPVTIMAPNQAPTRLKADAATVQGEAPPEVKALIEAKKRSAVQNSGREQAITAPSAAAARLGRPTMSEPAARRKKGGAPVAAILVVLLLIGAAAGAGWFFLLGPVSISVSSTPEGVEVLRGDEVLGTAPGKFRLKRNSEPVMLAFRKDGFITAQRKVETTADQELKVRLLPKEDVVEELDPPKPPAPKPSTPPVAVKPPEPKAPEPKPPAPKPQVAERPKPPTHTKKTPPPKKGESPLILTPSF